jgi:WW domain
VFSFSFVPVVGTSLNAGALATNPSVLSSIQNNVAAAVGVNPATIRIVNVTDIATGTVYSTGMLRALQARALAGAAGSLGVSFTCSINLGKVASSARVAALQSALVANFNATSPAFKQIMSDVATAAGVPSTSLVAVPPNPASIALSGNTAGLAPVIVKPSTEDFSGVLATDEAIGAGIGVAVVILAAALYSWRSYIVHGALPCQRDRKREQFELKQAAAREVEERMKADTVEATIVNPMATQGKGALTLRVPRAVALELEALRTEREENAKLLKKLEASSAHAATFSAAVSPASFAPVPTTGGKSLQAPPVAAPAASVWAEVKDPASGRSYFFNRTTKETSWTCPETM